MRRRGSGVLTLNTTEHPDVPKFGQPDGTYRQPVIKFHTYRHTGQRTHKFSRASPGVYKAHLKSGGSFTGRVVEAGAPLR